MRSVLAAVVGALALMATGPAAAGPSPAAGAPRVSAATEAAHSPRAASSRPRSVSLFSQIARTATGTFSATYRVGPPPGRREPTATVVVAQRASPGQEAWTTRPGAWTYRATTSAGLALNWTEVGERAWWCERREEHAAYRCGGPVTVESANNFIELTVSFLPGTATLALLSMAISSGSAPIPTRAIVAPAVGWGVGAQCLTLEQRSEGPYTWCVQGRRLVSVAGVFTGPIAQGDATLTRWSARAPADEYSPAALCPSRCAHVPGLPAF